MTFVPTRYFAAAAGSHGVDLDQSTHVLRATYYHPQHDAQRPLPAHTWMIYGANTREVLCSGNTDAYPFTPPRDARRVSRRRQAA